jgi:hypothetical protein
VCLLLQPFTQAIWLLTTGAREAAFRNVKTISECLADELMNAAKGSSNSYAIKKKGEFSFCACVMGGGGVGLVNDAAKGSSNSYAIKTKGEPQSLPFIYLVFPVDCVERVGAKCARSVACMMQPRAPATATPSKRRVSSNCDLLLEGWCRLCQGCCMHDAAKGSSNSYAIKKKGEQ